MGNAPESMVDPNGTLATYSSDGTRNDMLSAYARDFVADVGGAATGNIGGGGSGWSDRVWGGGMSRVMGNAAAVAEAAKTKAMAETLRQLGEMQNQGKGSAASNMTITARENYKDDGSSSSKSTYKKRSYIVMDEKKGGIIDNYNDFYDFMVDQANTNPKEVAAWKIIGSDNKEIYFIMPWIQSSEDESQMDRIMLRGTGLSFNDIVADYHTHPHSTGPSPEDAIGSLVMARQDRTYSRHTIGADGRIWQIIGVSPNRPLGIFMEKEGLNSNLYRYGKVIYNP